jgi:hypothetical protein
LHFAAVRNLRLALGNVSNQAFAGWKDAASVARCRADPLRQARTPSPKSRFAAIAVRVWLRVVIDPIVEAATPSPVACNEINDRFGRVLRDRFKTQERGPHATLASIGAVRPAVIGVDTAGPFLEPVDPEKANLVAYTANRVLRERGVCFECDFGLIEVLDRCTQLFDRNFVFGRDRVVLVCDARGIQAITVGNFLAAARNRKTNQTCDNGSEKPGFAHRIHPFKVVQKTFALSNHTLPKRQRTIQIFRARWIVTDPHAACERG